ncbi:cytochrome bd-I oxidase subunit CydX [Methylocystis heyeri]|uniref:Cytochrome bd-I oxidase subunit CydX n=1 Tax=Methylocystis heyeri TaxID=391905 RepID=A0A6B8KCB3_9HYPH|nr:cytochrome bd-I oxidase subunit CydX [Methylocystis heyeri]QGM45856.1 cytochrome bd-I oxidase subunit CydX [Methylocystis heyeri]
MWYFAWILGLGLACSFAILNAMWLELDPEYQASLSAIAGDAEAPETPEPPSI